MATSTGPSAELCQWACNTRHQDLPAEVRKQALTVLYDQVGCMIAASTLPSCQPVVDLVRKLGAPGECSIVGHPVRTTVTYAALANGTIGHGDEVDATGQHGTGHFAAAIIPTVLSVGQYVGAAGKELCRAIALGSEVAGRCVSLLGEYETRPQFAASVGHTLGTAVSAGTLLGLNAEQMEHALGLAAGGACGLNSHHEEELHQIKSLELGKAAEAGTLAALLAREGFHGTRSQRMEIGMTVRTRDGRVLRQELRFPVMSEAEIQKKFHDLVGLRLDAKRVADLERKLKGIEGENNVAPLIRELEIPY